MFSLALGAAELVFPRQLARLIGIEPSVGTSLITRLAGARGIAAGIGVLAMPRRPAPLWARVAGDALDIAMLGLAARNAKSGWRLLGAVAAVGGFTAVDIVTAMRTQKHYDEANRPVVFSVTIKKSPLVVYEVFRDFSRLPEFMDYLAEVNEKDSVRSHWVAKTPLGNVGWDAIITADVPGELIAWQSAPESRIKVHGKVTFAKAPGRESTEVRVEMKLGFTGIGVSTALAKLFSKAQIKGDLRRFKQIMETGEVLQSDASARRMPHAAQPSSAAELVTDAKHENPVFVPTKPTAVKGLEGPDAAKNEKGAVR